MVNTSIPEHIIKTRVDCIEPYVMSMTESAATHCGFVSQKVDVLKHTLSSEKSSNNPMGVFSGDIHVEVLAK